MPIIGDRSVSRLRFKRNYDLFGIESFLRSIVIDRIFKRGKTIDGFQMSKAKRRPLNSFYPYRYFTAELKNSTDVDFFDNVLTLEFKREEVILQYLTDQYGVFLGFGEEERDYIAEIINRQNLGRLNSLF